MLLHGDDDEQGEGEVGEKSGYGRVHQETVALRGWCVGEAEHPPEGVFGLRGGLGWCLRVVFLCVWCVCLRRCLFFRPSRSHAYEAPFPFEKWHLRCIRWAHYLVRCDNP